MPEGGQGVGDESDVLLADLVLQEHAVECGSDREKKFVSRAELCGGFENDGQVHTDFLDAAAGHESDPVLGGV